MDYPRTADFNLGYQELYFEINRMLESHIDKVKKKCQALKNWVRKSVHDKLLT